MKEQKLLPWSPSQTKEYAALSGGLTRMTLDFCCGDRPKEQIRNAHLSPAVGHSGAFESSRAHPLAAIVDQDLHPAIVSHRFFTRSMVSRHISWS